MMKTNSILAALAVLPVAMAFAADQPANPPKPKRDPAQVFKVTDQNGDGTISLDEYRASTVGHVDPSRVEDLFKKKDSDGDGKLTLAEFMYVPPQDVPKPASADGAKKDRKSAPGKKKQP